MGTEEAGRPGEPSFTTTTHARLRVQQGDVETARRILEAIVAERPGDREARELLDRLGASRGR